MRGWCMGAALAAGMTGAICAGPLVAQEYPAYVHNNVLATLYHELGHALIDIEGVPVYGQEEDAADVLAVLLIDAFWEEEGAAALAYDTALGFGLAAGDYDDVAFWDVHGPDLQRLYNTICLFYGANPEEREDIALELELPEERGDSCEYEFEQANDAWGQILDEISEGAPGNSLGIGVFDRDDEIAVLLEDEIDALDQDFVLSDTLIVSYSPCGEANAFYDPATREIVICTEYIDYLAEQAP